MQTIKTFLESTPLAIESMPYSWNTGVINTVVQWFEVTTVLGKRDELIRYFDKGDQRLALVSKSVNDLDSQSASSLDSTLTSLQTMISDIGQLNSELTTVTTVAEGYVWMCDKKATIYKIHKYVSYNTDTSKYEYTWSSLALDLQNGTVPSEAITEILYTLVDDNNIDIKNLEIYLKVLASNGHYYASLNAPDPSKTTYLQQLADALKPTNAYYVAAIQHTEDGSSERDALVTRLSINNIVITASKIVKTAEYKEDFSSYTKYQIPASNNTSVFTKPGTLFLGDDGVWYNVTQLQPAAQWVKSDKTAQQLQAEGKVFQIRGNIQTGGDVYELRMPGQKTLYRTDVSLAIKQEIASYKDESGCVHNSSNCNCYTITSNKTMGLVLDYTTDTRSAVNCFEDKYNNYANRYQISQIASLKKEEKTVEEVVEDRAKKKLDEDLQKIVKKYSIKLITEFIPGFDTAESVVEDIVTNTYGVYKEQKEVEEWNSNVDTIITNCSKLFNNYQVVDRTGDSIVELNTDGVAITTIYDDANISINIQ